VKLRGFKGYLPKQLEITALPGVITDLGSFAEYATVLSGSAPPAATVSNAVSTALAWRNARNSAEAWETYVKTGDAIAWKAATPLLEELRPIFLYAVSKNATLATKYPSLAAYFIATDEAAARAATTRKKNAKTRAAAAAAASADALATAKAQAAAAAVAPSKGVTVNA
jgi:hypothetical protein